MITFNELKKINVNDHTQKKGNLTYLSWTWAVDQLLSNDPLATWEYKEPKQFGDTLMVFCSVTAFGKTMTAQLPVLDYKNKAILNPDAFAVNTAMQRVLTKAIALHGLGLYIYSGEDCPEIELASQDNIDNIINQINKAETIDELKLIYKEAASFDKKSLIKIKNCLFVRKNQLGEKND
jgi:hypothetical protein